MIKTKRETKTFIMGSIFTIYMLTIGVLFTQQSKAYFGDVLIIKPKVITKEVQILSQMEQLKYNDRVPVEVIKKEIIKQSELFGNDKDFMLELAFCESGFDNLADNEISTAKGVYQFVANTWEATQSNKNKISEFDYKANIREAMIKIANGEYSHWRDCVNKIK